MERTELLEKLQKDYDVLGEFLASNLEELNFCRLDYPDTGLLIGDIRTQIDCFMLQAGYIISGGLFNEKGISELERIRLLLSKKKGELNILCEIYWTTEAYLKTLESFASMIVSTAKEISLLTPQ